MRHMVSEPILLLTVDALALVMLLRLSALALTT
jgi:hypothetical protein